ncbi:MAG: hypothetical protein QOK19_399 [Solirubrobacteraceae bacterium]|jgi:hypothetical protein|nr:hypothetical protein [Solirubrobacterales bacterium]MEA2214838.1 hypothetical protein [Solirubrobacteraceae bacterium]
MHLAQIVRWHLREGQPLGTVDGRRLPGFSGPSQG